MPASVNPGPSVNFETVVAVSLGPGSSAFQLFQGPLLLNFNRVFEHKVLIVVGQQFKDICSVMRTYLLTLLNVLYVGQMTGGTT
jgi:hypothetical protein